MLRDGKVGLGMGLVDSRFRGNDGSGRAGMTGWEVQIGFVEARLVWGKDLRFFALLRITWWGAQDDMGALRMTWKARDDNQKNLAMDGGDLPTFPHGVKLWLCVSGSWKYGNLCRS